jgi:TRAP-type uncharacterized transport system fused permease subunit
LQAHKNNIAPAPSKRASDAEPLGRTLWQGVPFILPFVLLIFLLVRGYSPFKACFYSMVVLVICYAAWTRDLGPALWRKLAQAISKGIRSAMPISVACAAAGIISGSLAVSGLGIKISSIIISASGGIAVVALLLTMLVAIVLGMGLPTTAAYLILATVVAPSLAELGVSPLTAHMFVFFYGCVSTITPPVALASYVAAGIANADISKVGWTAFAYGITCYLLPFMFFFGPALLSQGSWNEILGAAVSGALGVYMIAASVVGHLAAPLSMAGRSVALIAGIMLLTQGWVSDGTGALLGVGLAAFQRRTT